MKKLLLGILMVLCVSGYSQTNLALDVRIRTNGGWVPPTGVEFCTDGKKDSADGYYTPVINNSFPVGDGGYHEFDWYTAVGFAKDVYMIKLYYKATVKTNIVDSASGIRTFQNTPQSSDYNGMDYGKYRNFNIENDFDTITGVGIETIIINDRRPTTSEMYLRLKYGSKILEIEIMDSKGVDYEPSLVPDNLILSTNLSVSQYITSDVATFIDGDYKTVGAVSDGGTYILLLFDTVVVIEDIEIELNDSAFGTVNISLNKGNLSLDNEGDLFNLNYPTGSTKFITDYNDSTTQIIELYFKNEDEAMPIEIKQILVYGTVVKPDIITSTSIITTTINHGSIVKTYDLMGREVPKNTKRTILVIVYEDGFREQVYNN